MYKSTARRIDNPDIRVARLARFIDNPDIHPVAFGVATSAPLPAHPVPDSPMDDRTTLILVGAGILGVVIGYVVKRRFATPNRRRSRRPPKRWMRRCVSGVRRSGSAADPGAVCGDMWFHKLTSRQKASAKRMSYGRAR